MVVFCSFFRFAVSFVVGGGFRGWQWSGLTDSVPSVVIAWWDSLARSRVQQHYDQCAESNVLGKEDVNKLKTARNHGARRLRFASRSNTCDVE